MTSSAVTEQFDKCMKKQVEAIARVLHLFQSYKEDNIPCKIDEVQFSLRFCTFCFC